MNTKSYKQLMLLLMIIIISFPSICFSKLKTVDGEYCDAYLGDLKNKKELEEFRKTVRTKSIENGLHKHTNPGKRKSTYIISNYLEKVVVVSHTEKGRKICDRVRITLDPEVIFKYEYENRFDTFEDDSHFLSLPQPWPYDIDDILTKKNEKINIGLVIETIIPNLEVSKREQLENQQENEFFNMTERDKYKFIDRRHLKTILEEQKLSSSGITDSETVKIGKILNLDVIVLRMIYERSQITKVLKVDTGEVLLFKTYETKKETKKEGWISFGYTNDDVEWYYDNNSIIKVSPNISRVWNKLIYSKGWKEKNKDFIQNIKEKKLSKGDYNKLHHRIILYEIDCMKNTWKYMRYVDYSDEGESLIDFEDPFLLGTDRIIPDTILDKLRRKICE